MNQQIAISGLGGQGVLFLTRLLAETALGLKMDVLSSETHGMAMRGGAVISHLKVGGFSSPLIRAGRADTAFFLTEENLKVHPQIIGPQTKVLVNAQTSQYDCLDAARIAEETVGQRQAENLVLLGAALKRGWIFASIEDIKTTLAKITKRRESLEMNLKALEAGLRH